MKSHLIVTLALLFCSSLSSAVCINAVCEDVLVDRLYVTNNSVVYVGTDSTESALNCAAVSSKYLTLDTNDTNFETLYATLLSAQLADKRVLIRIAENSTNCKIVYITLDNQ